VLTGHLLKDPDANVVGAESAVVIDPSVDDFVRAITKKHLTEECPPSDI
jgi:hypothetical protein